VSRWWIRRLTLRSTSSVPGADPDGTGTVLITRNAVSVGDGFDVLWTARDGVAAWRG
jgi:hypothetical protein